jgi:hypothetical protein
MATVHPITLAGWRGTHLEFPEWAPKSLVEHYQDLLTPIFPYDPKSKELLFRLITYPKMKRAWASIYNYRRDPFHGSKPLDYVNEHMAKQLFFHIEDAYLKSEPVPVPKDKRSGRYRKISEAARELAALIEDSALDTTPYHWWPRDLVDSLFKTPVNSDSSERNQTGAISIPATLGPGEKTEYWRIAEQQKEQTERYGRPHD